MKRLSIALSFLCLMSSQAFAQSWLDVYNRYRISEATDWSAPEKIPRNDLRPFVTLSRRQQGCSDCRVERLSDAGRFALAMQGRGSFKENERIVDSKGETLLTSRDMEFLQTHAWDGAGKIFIGASRARDIVSPQNLVMALVTQIGVRSRPLAIKLKEDDEDRLIFAYRLLPLLDSDLGEPVVNNGRLVYPVQLRFNIFIYEPHIDPNLPVFRFQNSRDITFEKRTRIGQNTSVLTLKCKFLFNSPVTIEQNGFRALGSGRLVSSGEWMHDPVVEHLWVAHSYGSTASEHPALTPKALQLIQSKQWAAPELTKRLTTTVTFLNGFDAFSWLKISSTALQTEDDYKALQLLIGKKIEHAFHRKKIPCKVWEESIRLPQTSVDGMSLRMTFYGHYDQAKVLAVVQELGLDVDFSDRF